MSPKPKGQAEQTTHENDNAPPVVRPAHARILAILADTPLAPRQACDAHDGLTRVELSRRYPSTLFIFAIAYLRTLTSHTPTSSRLSVANSVPLRFRTSWRMAGAPGWWSVLAGATGQYMAESRGSAEGRGQKESPPGPVRMANGSTGGRADAQSGRAVVIGA